MADHRTISHKFISSIPDDPNTALVRPSDWNAPLIASGGSPLNYLMFDPTQTDRMTFDNVWGRFSDVDLSKPPYSIDLTGEVDATSTINNAIESLTASSRLLIPPGRIKISSTIFIRGKGGITLTGAYGRTELRWFGNATAPMFHIIASSECTLRGFNITCENPLFLGVVNDTDPSIGTNTRNRMEDIFMSGLQGTSSILTYGFLHLANGGNVGNDFHTYVNCTVTGYAYAAWVLGHQSSKGTTLYNCRFFGNRGGRLGVAAAVVSGGIPIASGGDFYCYGCGGGGNTVADFWIYGTSNHHIYGGTSRESTRFLVAADNEGANNLISPCFVSGYRWEQQFLHSDHYVIYFQEKGPLTLVGNTFGIAEAGLDSQVRILTFNSSNSQDGPGSGYVSIGNYYHNSVGSPFGGMGVTMNAGDLSPLFTGGIGTNNFYIPRFTTANLPPAGVGNDGRIVIEVAAAGDSNVVIYSGGERFRLDGGTPF